MDITTTTDTKALKALAYDELRKAEVAQNNLRLINQRITELEQAPPEPKPEPKKKD